jgi:uncharacterized repeat protein (TIGR03837 family)
LFCYESQAIASLFRAWSDGRQAIRCLVPQGRALADVAGFFGTTGLGPGDSVRQGALTVQILPMLDMDRYDRLLWACDCNFVRGEDSFVRAQWSGVPFVWQAYRQEEGAHWPKIEAFLDLYCIAMDADAATALRRFWRLWNQDGDVGPAWMDFWQARQPLLAHSQRWWRQLDQAGDLASNLVKFCNEKSVEKS